MNPKSLLNFLIAFFLGITTAHALLYGAQNITAIERAAPKTQPKPLSGVKPASIDITELPLPDPATDETIPNDDDSVFSLDVSYRDAEQDLFMKYPGVEDNFFLKMFELFDAEETYLPVQNPYEDATGEQQPFKSDSPSPTSGRLTFSKTVTSPAPTEFTSTFDPLKHTDVCGLWTSLISYCDGYGTECGCFSGGYYVPDQWNSLAAGCASLTTRCPDPNAIQPTTTLYWCSLAQTASAYMGFCPTDVDAEGTPIVKFAHRVNKVAPSTTSVPSEPVSTSDVTDSTTTGDVQPSEPSPTLEPSTSYTSYSYYSSSTPSPTLSGGSHLALISAWSILTVLVVFSNVITT